MIGEHLGKYAIDRLIGEGGMGAVYEGHDAATGRRVAVKVITGDVAKNPKLAQRFEVEAKAAGTITSEHVVQVLDVGTDARGAPFLVMEHLAGEDVEGLLARTGALAPDAAVRIAVHACAGLASAHARGVVHRDVKPGNLFLCAGPGGAVTVKLLDFGIAKVSGEVAAGAKLTRTGAILGSPLYMSPEQARTAHKIDHRTDLWSLGVVLYEMLAGHAPHHDIEGIGELILALCSQPVPPLRAAAPWVDPLLAAAVERALVIEPSGRYQSAVEMGDALRAFLPGGSAELTAAMLVPADRHGAPDAARAGLAFAATTPGELIPPAVLPVTGAGLGPPFVAAPAAGAAPAPSTVVAAPAHPPASAHPSALALAHPSTPAHPSALAHPSAHPSAPPVTPPPPPAREAPRRSPVPLVAGGLALAALGIGGAIAMGWLGGGAPPGGSAASAHPTGTPAAPATGAAPTATAPGGTASVSNTNSVTAPDPSPAGPLAALAGVWKSDSGRVYDAVLAGGGLEMRVRDPAQFEGQGYEPGEARFVLSLIPGDTARLAVEDRVRPLPPEHTAYDAARARPTCLVTWTEVNGQPLRARIERDRLTVDLVLVAADKSSFVLEGARVVRCEGLGRARVSGVKSVLVRQQ